jgi:hypothetical protein
MYVARVPNRGSPPAILLRESHREAGKVKNRTLANLSRWPGWQVDALAAVLKGVPPASGAAEAFEITRSLPYGHVAAVLGTLRALGLEEVIGPAGSRQRDLLVAVIVAAVIDGSSKLAIDGPRSAVIQSRRAGLTSSLIRALVSMPRSPTRAR